MHNGVKKVLSYVRFIPKLKRTLISLRALDELGYVIKLEVGLVKVMRGSLLEIKGIKKIKSIHY